MKYLLLLLLSVSFAHGQTTRSLIDESSEYNKIAFEHLERAKVDSNMAVVLLSKKPVDVAAIQQARKLLLSASTEKDAYRHNIELSNQKWDAYFRQKEANWPINLAAYSQDKRTAIMMLHSQLEAAHDAFFGVYYNGKHVLANPPYCPKTYDDLFGLYDKLETGTKTFFLYLRYAK